MYKKFAFLSIVTFVTIVSLAVAQNSNSCILDDQCSSGVCLKEVNTSILRNEFFFLMKGDFVQEFKLVSVRPDSITITQNNVAWDWGFDPNTGSGAFGYSNIQFPFQILDGKLTGENIFLSGVCAPEVQIPEFSLIMMPLIAIIGIGLLLFIKKNRKML